MAKQNPPSIVAFPTKEIERILEDNKVSQAMAASYMKFYAPDIELAGWESSQMPDLTYVYAYSHQLCDFLEKKLNDPSEAEMAVAEQYDSDQIPFTVEEVIMLTGVIKAVEKSVVTLKMRYNISFEVH